MRPKGIPGVEEQSARQRELQVLGVGETVEDAVCADERSVCMIQLCRPRVGTREGETGFWDSRPRGVDLNIERAMGAMRSF